MIFFHHSLIYYNILIIDRNQLRPQKNISVKIEYMKQLTEAIHMYRDIYERTLHGRIERSAAGARGALGSGLGEDDREEVLVSWYRLQMLLRRYEQVASEVGTILGKGVGSGPNISAAHSRSHPTQDADSKLQQSLFHDVTVKVDLVPLKTPIDVATLTRYPPTLLSEQTGITQVAHNDEKIIST